jgi:transposase-like protein
MARKSDTDELKIAAARLVREQGSSAKAAGERLGVDPCSVRDWVRRFAPEPAAADPEASAEQLRQENLRLREEKRRLLMGRESLKSDGLLREGAAVKFAFIRDHQAEFPVEVLCDVLEVSRSGFYACRPARVPGIATGWPTRSGRPTPRAGPPTARPGSTTPRRPAACPGARTRSPS